MANEIRSTQFIVHFATQVCSLLPLVYVVASYVTNTNYEAEKDIVFVPTHEAEVLHLHISDESVASEAGAVEEKVATKN